MLYQTETIKLETGREVIVEFTLDRDNYAVIEWIIDPESGRPVPREVKAAMTRADWDAADQAIDDYMAGM